MAGHLALNAAIIEFLLGLGASVTVLLVGSRITAPILRYGLASVAGPNITSISGIIFAKSPAGIAQIAAKAAIKRLPPRLATRLRATRHGADAVLGSFPSQPDLDWCAQHIARAKPDAVLIDTIFRAPLLADPRVAGVNSVIIAHDVFYRRHAALMSAGYSVKPEKLTREDEAAMLSKARHIAAIQPEEAARIASMCPAANVFTAPMPATPCPLTSPAIPGRLVFAGSATLPNLDGLRWFLAHVWPLLARRGVTLDLAGDCGAAMGTLPPGVTALGRLQHLAPVLHRAMLAIAPLRIGSGLKIKLLDYARHGLFTVATPQSLDGFASDPAAPYIAAETPQEFASAILRQLESPGAPSQAHGYVTRHYGTEICFAGLKQAIG